MSTRSNISSPKDSQLKIFTTTARALVISHKGPCSLRELDNDYKEIEGQRLPFRQFGFNTAEDLLIATEEFNVNQYGNQTYISAKPNAKTGHIVALVSGQKSVKTKRSSGPLRKPFSFQKHMPVPWTHTANYTRNDSNNNDRGYNSNQINQNSNNSQQQNHHRLMWKKQTYTQPAVMEKNEKDFRQRSIPNNYQPQTNTQYPKQMAQRPILGNNNNTITKTTAKPEPQLPKQSPKQQPIMLSKEEIISQYSDHIHIHSAQQQEVAAKKIVSQPSLPIHTRQESLQIEPVQIKQTSTIYPNLRKKTPLRISTVNSSVQGRLKVTNKTETNNARTVDTVPSELLGLSADKIRSKNANDNSSANIKLPLTQSNTHEVAPFMVYVNGKLDYKESLLQYCVSNNFPEPEYSLLVSKFSKNYQCRVLVNASIYSTYPNEYKNMDLAKTACAESALLQIKLLMTKLPLPICNDSDHELTKKLYKALLDHPNGLFAKKIPQWFEEKFSQSLPEYWWTLIQVSSSFTTEVLCTDEAVIIVFAIPNVENVENENAITIQMASITLPWSERCWNIYVTYCVGAMEVWGRLCGYENKKRFEALSEVISTYMLSNKKQPCSITCGLIYLRFSDNLWHRVRVEEMSNDNEMAKCFFIDFGDTEWLHQNDLYICETRFLELPAQAILFSLYGLEDFSDHPHAQRVLNALILNKSLLMEPLTKESDFYTKNLKTIHGVLYDTSTKDDISLNPLALKEICDSTPVPMIKLQHLTNILVTHVCDDGDLYVQVVSPELMYLKKLLRSVTRFDMEKYSILNINAQPNDIFLICMEQTCEQTVWCRGMLSNTNVNATRNELDIFFVDEGFTRRVQKSQIFLLCPLSVALSKFPHQALKVRLHNIPKCNLNVVGRIRALLPASSDALAKMVTTSTLPLVIIYRRIEGTNTPCTINDVLRIEQELEVVSDTIVEESSSDTIEADIVSPCSTITNLNETPPLFVDVPIKSYTKIPPVGQFFEVRVTMAANPSNFTIQPYNAYPCLRNLMKELQEYCDKNGEFIPNDMVESGQAYAAKNPDGFFHRVIVVHTLNSEIIHVYYCDFGDVAILRSDQLKMLPAKFRKLPKMALQSKLYGICPSDKEWTHADCQRFRQLTVGKTFMAVIKKVSFNNAEIPMLELDLLDVETDEDICIANILLAEKRAVEMNCKIGV